MGTYIDRNCYVPFRSSKRQWISVNHNLSCGKPIWEGARREAFGDIYRDCAEQTFTDDDNGLNFVAYRHEEKNK